MNVLPAPIPTLTVTADEVYYALFRHKWKIVVCTILGLIAAFCFYKLRPAPYQSEAMIFIRYVTESEAPGMPGNDSRQISPDQQGTSIVNTEVELLSSLDIAYQVTDVVGISKILSGSKDPKDRDHAAALVARNLIVDPLPNSSVIRLIFSHPDPAVVQPVLSAIIEAYLKKHVEVRGIGAVGDLLSQETDQLRSRLTQTEDDLRKVKSQAGTESLDDSKRAYADQERSIQHDIFAAQADLAERSSFLQALEKSSANRSSSSPIAGTAALEPSGAQVDEYRNLSLRLEELGRTESKLLDQFTPQSQRVQNLQVQIEDAEAKKQKLTDQFPQFSESRKPTAAFSGGPTGTIDLVAESARLSGVQSRIKVLNAELQQVHTAAANLDQAEGRIVELQRQKELQDANYRYYAVHLEANRIDEALGAGHALNIAEIQEPSPPHLDITKTRKTTGIIAVAGLLLGLVWSLLMEFHFDRSIRRPIDVTRLLGVPLFLSIPRYKRKKQDHHAFHETLRDRLIGYFENRDLTHKPKLLAITGVGRNAGVTTVASGLAQCLSETGDGNVLLVDMTSGQGAARRFYKGNIVCGLDGVLSSRENAQVQDKLFVVGEEPTSSKLSRTLPARFNQLVPLLKASDFDYIIFDMPAVSQISVTPRLARFMDMVLVVVESEHTLRDSARQAATLLAESGANVGVVLNKSREYLPPRLRRDFVGIG